MSKATPQNPAKTAAQLMRELQNDPTYKAQMEIKQHQRSAAQPEYLRQEKLVTDELLALGYKIASLDELRRSGIEYRSAIPILLKWLQATTDQRLKEALVRALSVPWAKSGATRILLDEFRQTSENQGASLKWAIGNALEVLADDSCAQELLALARDPQHGKAREMVVLALAKLNDPRAEGVLKELLSDEQVAGHAVLALSNRPSVRDLSELRPFLNHRQEWVRDAAKKGMNQKG